MSEQERRFPGEDTRRGRTVSGELAARFSELGDEDISAAIDGLIASSGVFPGVAVDRLTHDRQADVELKETFNNIVMQFLDPVGFSLQSLTEWVARNGDPVEKDQALRGNVEACIGALKPLINAADAIKYHDIYDVLKAIERPLLDVQLGKRLTLTDRDTKNLLRDFNELKRLIHQNTSAEPAPRPLLPQQVNDVKERFRTASTYLISEMLPFFKEIEPEDVQKVYSAGITRLSDLVIASPQEISEASGVSVQAAEKMKICTLRALMQAPVDPPAATPTAEGPMSSPVKVMIKPPIRPEPETPERELVGSALAELRLDEETVSPQPAAIYFPEVPPPPGERERLMQTLEIMQQEIGSYGQAATNLNAELERTHRALLRLRVERERLHGELEFHRDELKQFFEQGGVGDEESQEALAVHKGMFQALRQVTEVILVAMKKLDIIYGQMEDSVRDIRDLEIEISDLRRKRRPRVARGRLNNPENEN